MKRIEWTTLALRQLRKIGEHKDRVAIHDAVTRLGHFPNVQNIKRLANSPYYRLRVSSWRVIFSESKELIVIEKVKKRNERTYQ